MKIWTPEMIKASKRRHFLSALTVYDYPMTRMLDELGIPMLLVGDSLGMVVLGYPDTTHVTMDDMLHHVKAAARANPKSCLVGDMPYQSYFYWRSEFKKKTYGSGGFATQAIWSHIFNQHW